MKLTDICYVADTQTVFIEKRFKDIIKPIKKHLDIISTISLECRELCNDLESKIDYTELTVNVICQELEHLGIKPTVKISITESFYDVSFFNGFQDDDDEENHFLVIWLNIEKVFDAIDEHLKFRKLQRNRKILNQVIKDFKKSYIRLRNFRFNQMMKSKNNSFLKEYKQAEEQYKKNKENQGK